MYLHLQYLFLIEMYGIVVFSLQLNVVWYYLRVNFTDICTYFPKTSLNCQNAIRNLCKGMSVSGRSLPLARLANNSSHSENCVFCCCCCCLLESVGGFFLHTYYVCVAEVALHVCRCETDLVQKHDFHRRSACENWFRSRVAFYG